ncbi:MAG: DUF2799 domain-containing protein, partial [Burkholderiales bacterium]|nr:DUF2799 domain-containing protein [Burkholderiales bacterium]
WVRIGEKDGNQGLDRNFDERQHFCTLIDSDKLNAGSAQSYEQGWQRGNQQYWFSVGKDDGKNAHPLNYYFSLPVSDDRRQNNPPQNRPAYEQGWQQGNAEYWYQLGDQDGRAGRKSSDETERARAGAAIGFRQDSYRQGWRDGNYAYWQQIGYQDAHDGIPDSELIRRAASARSSGLEVREDAYAVGWNREIVEYWKNLGWNDAITGRDIHTRRDDAKKRGLKIFEAEYQQQWEKRLIQYWQDVGHADGDGHPFQLEQRMANARNDNVFVIAQTRDVYQQAWSEQNARYCTTDHAFSWGRENRPMAIEVCAVNAQNRLHRVWLSGQDYELLNVKLQATQRDSRTLADRYENAERRLARLEKDIRRDQEDKNRPKSDDNARLDRQRDHERQELRDMLRETRRRLDELRNWEFRYEQQMRQIRRDSYLE